MKFFVFSALLMLATAVPLDTEWTMWKRVSRSMVGGKQLKFFFFVTPQEHGKQYSSEAEENLRYGVWKQNSDMIDSHNKRADAGEETFWMGMNHLGDMTREEIVATFNGYKMESDNSTEDVFEPSPYFVPEENVDWRTKGAVTPVKNQGQCGSCWAFSTTGSLEGQHFLKKGKLVSLSEQNLVDCSKKNDGCQGGLMVTAFEFIIKNDGIDTEESYPYKGHNEKCRFKEQDVGATETSYKKISKDSVSGVMEACSKVGPISVAMDASRSSFQFYKKGIYKDKRCSSKKLDHGVLCVGYGTESGEDYFLIKNSWGKRWGMEGYFMISREDNMCGIATSASYPIV